MSMMTTHTYTLVVTQFEDGSGFATLADNETPFDPPLAEGYAIRPDDAVTALFHDLTFNLIWMDTDGS